MRQLSPLLIVGALWSLAAPGALPAQAPPEWSLRNRPVQERSFTTPPSLPAAEPDTRRITHSSQTGASDASPRTSSAGSLWSTLGALALVLLMILGGARVFRRHAPRAIGVIPSEALEILGHRSLGRRQAIHLVRLGSRLLVLGSSEEGLRTLAEIADPVEVDCLAGLCRNRDAETGFSQAFVTFFQRQGRAAPEPAGGGAAASPEAVPPLSGRRAPLRPPREDAHA